MMRDYRMLEQYLVEVLGNGRRPVAIAFREAAPPGVEQFTGSEPSGCSFWRLAAEGRSFYTVPEDHYNCPIGSYTHNLSPPPERLQETLELMTGAGYLKPEEVPGVMRLPQTPAAVIYAPLGDTPAEPDVVIATGRPGRVMLLIEAALRAGLYSNMPLLARPTCMAIPAALAHGAVASAGCIGSRVYTEIGEDELYIVLPGSQLDRLTSELRTIADANARLAEYHRERVPSLRRVERGEP